MRKVLLLLVAALLWGCQERMISPEDVVKINEETEYGTIALRLSGLKEASGNVKYSFKLRISGDGMDDMVYTFPIGQKDTMVVIENIPAGTVREFSGVLRAGETITHEGVADTRIEPGKVAFVKLHLVAAGSAQVEVIIDDGSKGIPVEGCMKLEGEIEDERLAGLSIEITITDFEFWSYIKRDGEFAGKLWGTFTTGQFFEGEFSFEGARLPYLVTGQFAVDGSGFRAEAFDINDTTSRLGVMQGSTIDCGDVPVNPSLPPPLPPPAFECLQVDGVILDDTLFGEVYMSRVEFTDDRFVYELFRWGDYIGEFNGYFDNEMRDFTGFWKTEIQTAMVKGVFTPEGDMFKGIVLDNEDTTQSIGYIDGTPVECSKIIEDDPPPPKPNLPASIMGCFELMGEFDTQPLEGIVSITKDYENNSFHASLAREGVYAGYIFGYADDEVISGHMVYEDDTAMVKGDFYVDGDAFSAALFSIYDTTEVIGKLHGEKIVCPEELFK